MAWENLTLDDETTNGAADTTAAPATDVTGLGTETGGLDDGSLVDNGGADASVDTVDSSGDDETAKQKANALVGAAENLVIYAELEYHVCDIPESSQVRIYGSPKTPQVPFVSYFS